MKNTLKIGLFLALVMMMAGFASCCKTIDDPKNPLVGHWGCEQYVSCRTDSTGFEKWETLEYEVGPGLGYEVYFYNEGSGKLMLNESPALIKNFSCDYSYDSVNQVLTIYNTNWIISMFSDATSADMDIESVTDSTIVASWINHFSEPVPFFERFYMKRIE